MAGPSLQKGRERDYYADLELPPTADAEEIKKEHRRLALKYHPDKNPGDKNAEENFLIIQTAYEILSNPEERARHDAQRKNPTTKARAEPQVWRQNQPKRYWDYDFTKSKAKANNSAPTTAAGGKRWAPAPTPRATASTRQRAGASFGSSNSGSDPLTDKSRAKPGKYSSRHASTPVPDTSAQAPPPFPQRPSPTVETDPPNTVNRRTMDKGDSTPATSLQSDQPTNPPEPPKQRQQPAESKQSSSTVPLSSADQDTNEEGQPDNTLNSDEKRPDKPKTSSNLDKEGSRDAREFHKVSALSFPTPPTDTQNFDKYLEEWNLFEIKIIGHYTARKEPISKLKSQGNSNIKQYYEWLLQDDDLCGLFIEAAEEHVKQFREFTRP